MPFGLPYSTSFRYLHALLPVWQCHLRIIVLQTAALVMVKLIQGHSIALSSYSSQSTGHFPNFQDKLDGCVFYFMSAPSSCEGIVKQFSEFALC